MNLTERIINLEMKYREENFPGSDTFEIIHGHLPILISAPHSVTHYRNKNVKQGEFMTGVLATLLQERLDCYSITKTKNDNSDPNFDEVHPYKEKVKELIKKHKISFLIDLHIMANKRPAAIEIGTGSGKNVFMDDHYANVLRETFESHMIRPVIVDEHFTGGFKNTVSSDVSRSVRIPCIQIEVNWRLLDVNSTNHQIFAVIDSLEASIKQLRRKP
ncbi:hypothetical protein V7114_24465 [Neobacillus niacini]|uniref:hypothetical protein n=1 Tax=Neobacillus niacini TaxID=86668 RepID=UPI002FFF5EB8